MKIGIFGGTFNPIHIGHMNIADNAARDLKLDLVLFVPSSNPYTKLNDNMATHYNRQMMAVIATQHDHRFRVCDDYIEPGQPTYTYITVKKLKELYKEDKLYLILGEDAYIDFCKWKNYQELIKDITGFYVCPRDNKVSHDSLEVLYDNLRYLNPSLEVYVSADSYELTISSTEIRKRINEDKSCRYLLPEGVYQYILDHKLYK